MKIQDEWLKSAEYDLLVIEKIIDDENLSHIVAFHAQQSLEKSFKAFIEAKRIQLPKIHKLQTLVDKIDIDLEIDDEIIQVLDQLYIEARYPGDLGLLPNGKPTKADSKKFYEYAKSVYSSIKGII